MGDFRPYDLKLGDTVRRALGVMRRRWLALALLWLIFDGASDLLEWLFATMGGLALVGAPAMMVIHVVGAAVGGVLLACGVANVVNADLGAGQGVTPAGALAIPWARTSELLLLWTLLAAPLVTLSLNGDEGVGTAILAMVFRVLDLGAYAIVGLMAALSLTEHPAALQVWPRLAALTRGVRLKLAAVMVMIILVQAFATTATDLAGLLLATQLAPSGNDVALITRGLRFPGYLVTNAFATLLTVWGAVVYRALRRSSEGLGEDGLDVFT